MDKKSVGGGASGAGAGADGLGEYSGVGGQAPAPAQATALAELVKTAMSHTAMATMVPGSERTTKMATLYTMFGATSPNAKLAVRVSLVVFFAVHGTSPHTAWASFPHPIVSNGVTRPAIQVVEVIGVSTLKRFLAYDGQMALEAYNTNGDFRKAMRSRYAGAGLSEENGFLVIDFIGKSGDLDPAMMSMRARVKSRSVVKRNDEVRRTQDDGAAEAVQAREIGSSQSAVNRSVFS